MNGYTSDQVFNGTYGEVWFDGDYMAETESLKAEVDLAMNLYRASETLQTARN